LQLTLFLRIQFIIIISRNNTRIGLEGSKTIWYHPPTPTKASKKIYTLWRPYYSWTMCPSNSNTKAYVSCWGLDKGGLERTFAGWWWIGKPKHPCIDEKK
jgi:hypothetical protein